MKINDEMLGLLTWVKWVEYTCVAVSQDVIVSCCRYGVGAPWRLAKLSTAGCVKNGGGVEHSGLSEVDRLMLSNMASCRVVV